MPLRPYTRQVTSVHFQKGDSEKNMCGAEHVSAGAAPTINNATHINDSQSAGAALHVLCHRRGQTRDDTTQSKKVLRASLNVR